MANNNPLTSGEYATDGLHNSSDKGPHTYAQEQLAVKAQEATKGAVKDAAKAAERAARRALNGANNPYNPGVPKGGQFPKSRGK